MNISEILANAPGWFAFGSITCLGALITYKLLQSRIVQLMGVLLMSMFAGVIAFFVVYWLLVVR